MRRRSSGRVFDNDELVALASAATVTGADRERGERPTASTEPQVVAEAADACPVPGRGTPWNPV